MLNYGPNGRRRLGGLRVNLPSSKQVYQVMRIEPTCAYEDIWNYNTIDVVSHLLLPSSGRCFFKVYITKDIKTNFQI
jgi:hypothetical protein